MLFTVSLLVFSLLSLCGATKSKIIGGKEVTKHSRPYMVSVQINNSHVCGGMLIREDYVLTSAHCVNKTDCSGKNRPEVVLGAHNIKKREKNQQRIHVDECTKHPSYKEISRLNDIMLLKLKTAATLNDYVGIIRLPEENVDVPVHEECFIDGWGKTQQNSAGSSVLREVPLKLECNSKCSSLWQMYFDEDSMICTASDGKKAFCQGDSGSPLICGSYPLGLAAYTHPNNCLSQYPEVYMKISYFVPWIKEVIEDKN